MELLGLCRVKVMRTVLGMDILTLYSKKYKNDLSFLESDA
jgi:hypothetical protein